MTELARQTPKDTFPSEVDLSLENFEKYKSKWLKYRRAGSRDAAGNFISPISYLEAEQLPKSMMDTFHELNYLYSIAERIAGKEKAGK